MPPRRRRIADLRTTPVSTAWRQAGTRRSNVIGHNIRRHLTEAMSHPRWHEDEFYTSRKTAAAERAGTIYTIDDDVLSIYDSRVCQILYKIWKRDKMLIASTSNQGIIVRYCRSADSQKRGLISRSCNSTRKTF